MREWIRTIQLLGFISSKHQIEKHIQISKEKPSTSRRLTKVLKFCQIFGIGFYCFPKLIWVPDTFFVNEKTALFHQATTENQFLRIMHTGDILRSIRLTIKATCPLNLEYFPMDKQMCTLEIESFGYTMSGTVKDTRDHSSRRVPMYFSSKPTAT